VYATPAQDNKPFLRKKNKVDEEGYLQGVSVGRYVSWTHVLFQKSAKEVRENELAYYLEMPGRFSEGRGIGSSKASHPQLTLKLVQSTSAISMPMQTTKGQQFIVRPMLSKTPLQYRMALEIWMPSRRVWKTRSWQR
jgi:hypothetical protein